MEKRLRVLFIFFIIIFVVIAVRLFYWQIILSDRFDLEGDSQRVKTLTIPARRGIILSSDGSPLVANKRAFLIYAQPQKIRDLTVTENKLSDILQIPLASISGKLSDSKLVWVPVSHKVDETTKIKLERENLAGIGFAEEDIRYYPESSMAAQLLGFVGKDAKGDDMGYFGLEGFYNRQLRGRNGYIRQETDARGIPIIMGDQQRIEPENGRDLVLNVDKSVQFIIEKELKSSVDKYGAQGGWVVVMDPYTGAVLGMAAQPSYDPGNFASYEGQLYKNPIVAGGYEPGSTFKTLIMSAAINEKKVRPSLEFVEDGPVEVGGYQIRTWNNKYSGKITAIGILEKSSNVGMVKVGKLLGKENLLDYINSFGIGKPTGIDLEEEESPELRSSGKWYDIDYATATFGQGIAVTGIQMIRAVAAIANDGKLMVPHIVNTIIDSDGKKITIDPEIEKQVLSPDTAHIMSEMMVEAVDHGEASFAKPKGYRIAGKTGTAQIPIAGHYDPTKTIASFVGFAPVPNPKFVMLVKLDQPSSSQWGAETAAPLFFSIAKELFKYYGISPSE